METEKAKIYLTALHEGSFKAAAEKLGYTTSGISRSIASLEEETGVLLFIRDRTGIRPTPEAALFIPIFEKLVAQDRIYHETIKRIHGVETGCITIGISYSAYFRIMAKRMKAFCELYPGITINTVQKTSSELLELLDAGEIDFAIMTKRTGKHCFYKLLDDPMVACVSGNNPLSELESFPLEKFAREPMAVAYPDIETDYRNVLEAYGITPNICYSASDVFAAYCMVEADLGISLSNLLEVDHFEGNVVLLKTDPQIDREIGIMYNKLETLTVAGKRFLQYIMDQLPECHGDV